MPDAVQETPGDVETQGACPFHVQESPVVTSPAFRWTVVRLLPTVLALTAAAVAVTLSTDRLRTEPTGASSDARPTAVALDTSGTALPFHMAGMVPGDTAGPHELAVSNDDDVPYRYAVTSTTSEDTLATQLDLWVWLEADEADTATLGLAPDNHTCDATPGHGIGSYLYEQGPVGSTTTTALVGDPTRLHPDDRVLAADDEVLCFYAELPHSTGNDYQGLQTAAEFTVHAEQTSLD